MTNLVALALLALVVAVISRTVTQETIFVELRNWAKARRSKAGKKIAYPLTCQYCFSHWVAAGLALVTGYRVTSDLPVFVSFFVSVFVLVGLANALLISYELATLKVKVQRAQAELIAQNSQYQLMRNEVEEMNLKGLRQMAIQVEQHNAGVAAAQAEAQAKEFGVAGSFLKEN